eukprot:1391821-Rhodomonas_salina.1
MSNPRCQIPILSSTCRFRRQGFGVCDQHAACAEPARPPCRSSDPEPRRGEPGWCRVPDHDPERWPGGACAGPRAVPTQVPQLALALPRARAQ